MIAAIAIILIATGSACATRETTWQTARFPLPARPALPRVTETDLAPLSVEAYRKVEERDRGRRQYAEKLEQIICSTRPYDTDPRCKEFAR